MHLPINPDNVKRVTIKGRNLYTVVGFRDLFLPPFSTRTDSDSLLDQLTAATTTAWKRLVRDCLPFPRFGGMLMPVCSGPPFFLDLALMNFPSVHCNMFLNWKYLQLIAMSMPADSIQCPCKLSR